MEITEFLKARYAEDEAARWKQINDEVATLLDAQPSTTTRDDLLRAQDYRPIADIASKRAIVDLDEAIPMRLEGDWDAGRNDLHWDVLCLLAQPYDDHPDYDPTWRRP